MEVFPDPGGVVRTMNVEMRPRDKRTDGNVLYTNKDLLPMSVPIQHVALLMPKEKVDEELAKGERVVDKVESRSREKLNSTAVQINKA